MVVHEYLKLFVFQKRMVSYEYFMDDMQEWELLLLADNYNNALKEEWEMTRWQVYTTIKPYLKKQYANKTPQEVFPLPTDKIDDAEEEHNTEITNAEIDEMKKISALVQKQLKRQSNGK